MLVFGPLDKNNPIVESIAQLVDHRWFHVGLIRKIYIVNRDYKQLFIIRK